MLLWLSGCFLSPGKFTSTLDIGRDRSFTFTYVGEVIAPPPGQETEGAADETAEAAGATTSKRSPAKESASDTARMRALAEALSQEYGYRSVKYLGGYRFAIDYRVSGTLNHGFVFPFNPDGEVLIPFLLIELRGKDRVRLKAPGFAPTGNQGPNLPGVPGMGAIGRNDAADAIDGSFTITTDAEIVSQNEEKGTEGLPDGRRRITWRATPQTRDAPTAVFRVNALP